MRHEGDGDDVPFAAVWSDHLLNQMTSLLSFLTMNEQTVELGPALTDVSFSLVAITAET